MLGNKNSSEMGSVPISAIAIPIHSIGMNRNRSRLGSTNSRCEWTLSSLFSVKLECMESQLDAWNPSWICQHRKKAAQFS